MTGTECMGNKGGDVSIGCGHQGKWWRFTVRGIVLNWDWKTSG